jgi:hypothetical protein
MNLEWRPRNIYFYTGLILSTIIPILAYSLNFENVLHRRLFFLLLLALIIGGIIMDGFGGWIASAAKEAW